MTMPSGLTTSLGALLVSLGGAVIYAVRVALPGILARRAQGRSTQEQALAAKDDQIRVLLAQAAAADARWNTFLTNHLEHERQQRESFAAHMERITISEERSAAIQAETLDQLKHVRDKQEELAERLAEIKGWIGGNA